MKLTSRIPAYTLAELIVVMILTTIVVGLAFSTLRLVQSHMTAIQANYDKKREVGQFNSLIELDFNRFNNITYDKNTDVLTFKNPLDSLNYQFSESKIIMGEQTLNIPISEKVFFYDGEKREAGEIDAIRVVMDSLNKAQFFVFKVNDPTRKIN
ncbi:hypothetical protein [Nonlabens agnitus]|uniref:Prepilin-type N-terminal cleavage/methylation domain-containing protein n=1 Tax=Nonlabens agnitus TaxID=870484 RepID=A0A2S9WQW5_9FLAO|nr:hypothetical protein [Nonlabens agnitus]PRP65880.1 hypothetical protein BST86_01635 [Nonlabens agnitus]